MVHPAAQASRWTSPKAFYRERWTANLGGVSVSERAIEVTPLSVLHRFDGGMVYEIGKEQFLVAERTFGADPFLLLFSVARDQVDARSTRFYGVPDEVVAAVAPACDRLSRTVKLPGSLHTLEVDVTALLSRAVNLPKGYQLTKALFRLGPGGGVMCDCDVDGPCGYCCDTCDCDTCRPEEIGIEPIEIRVKGHAQ